MMQHSLVVYISRCTSWEPIVALATQTVYDNLFCMVIFSYAEKGSKRMWPHYGCVFDQIWLQFRWNVLLNGLSDLPVNPCNFFLFLENLTVLLIVIFTYVRIFVFLQFWRKLPHFVTEAALEIPTNSRSLKCLTYKHYTESSPDLLWTNLNTKGLTYNE